MIPLLYCIVLCAACGANFLFLRGTAHRQRPARVPGMTICLCALLAALLCAQLLFPAVLSSLERDDVRIAAGEWWRLLTSLFVQDGGLAGGMFNMASLLAAGGIVEQIWKMRYALASFLLCGWLTQLPALLWQPVGAGNSVGTFGLVTGAAVYCACTGRRAAICVPAAITVITGCILVAFHDIHGIAVLAGALTGCVIFFMEMYGLRIRTET